jgi:hypothetical protein
VLGILVRTRACGCCNVATPDVGRQAILGGMRNSPGVGQEHRNLEKASGMTKEVPAEIYFDVGAPFYEMISAYSCAISGLESIANPANLMSFKPGDVVTLVGKVHPQIRIGQLAVHRQFIAGNISAQTTTHSLACMLLTTAYTAVEDENDQTPEFEFFRHLRNAASHGNRFCFKKREPIRPAFWRRLAIEESPLGNSNPLHGVKCIGNFLGSADVILLLWDIERKLRESILV